MATMETGLRFFVESYVMSQHKVLKDGTSCTLAGVVVDPLDPFAPIYTRRAVSQMVSELKLTTRMDVLTIKASEAVRVHGKGRNGPRTIAALLIASGQDDVLDAMVELYAAFIAEELAA